MINMIKNAMTLYCFMLMTGILMLYQHNLNGMKRIDEKEETCNVEKQKEIKYIEYDGVEDALNDYYNI